MCRTWFKTLSKMWRNRIFRFKRGLEVSSHKLVSDLFFPPNSIVQKNSAVPPVCVWVWQSSHTLLKKSSGCPTFFAHRGQRACTSCLLSASDPQPVCRRQIRYRKHTGPTSRWWRAPGSVVRRLCTSTMGRRSGTCVWNMKWVWCQRPSWIWGRGKSWRQTENRIPLMLTTLFWIDLIEE